MARSLLCLGTGPLRPRKERTLPTKRTTHRSTAGKKLYAVRDEKGRFADLQTYERAHRADLSKKSAAELGKDRKKPN
jgi:hypothetical protein